MIDGTTIVLVAAGAQAVVFAGLVLWLPHVEEESRLVCGFVAGVVGVGAVANLLIGLEIGDLSVAGGSVIAPLLVSDLVAYPGFFLLAASLAGASGRLLGTIAAITVSQRVAFELAYGGFVDGLSALAAAAVVVVGWLVVLYLFLRPVWAEAQEVPAGQRLLHWKCRNLLLFMVGMLIVFGMLLLAGIFDTFVSTVTSTYVAFLIRAGLAGFIFANADAIAGDAVDGAKDRHDGVAGSGISGD